MSNEDTRTPQQELQFDRVISDASAPLTPGPERAACTVCQTPISTEYYSVNGHTVCLACRNGIEAAGETPRGAGPLLRAGVFGLGAGVVGAAIYYGVIVLTNFEIGIVAILIGYMVGYSVRKGAHGRGGRRFQVLAIALTYASVALAYTPLAVKGAMDANRKNDQETISRTASTSQSSPVTSAAITSSDAAPALGGFVLAIATLLGLVAALPVLVVFSSLPSGLISAAIIFFGMQQAWRMTGAPSFQISGPYRIATDPASTSA